MSKQLISNVAEGTKAVVKLNKFRKVRELVKEINKSYGYNRFTDIAVNKVYYIGGCGILIEFQDAEKTMSVVSNIDGKVLSCRLTLNNIEAMSILNRFRCSVTPSCLVLE